MTKLKLAQVIIVTLIVFFTLISLGVFGKHLTYYFELKTDYEKDKINDVYGSYIMGLKSCVAFNAIILIFLPLYIAGTWYLQNGSCVHKALTVIYILFWFARWLSGIVFLEGNNKWKEFQILMHEQFEDNPELCESPAKIRDCAYADSYIQSKDYEIFFIVLFFILGIFLVPVLYKLNKEKTDQYGTRGHNYKQQSQNFFN